MGIISGMASVGQAGINMVAGVAGPGMLSPLTSAVAHASNSAMPIQFPSPEDTLALIAQRFNDVSRVQTTWDVNGRRINITADLLNKYELTPDGKVAIKLGWKTNPDTLWNKVVKSKVYIPSHAEILLMVNRGVMDDFTGRQLLTDLCDGNSAMAKVWGDLRYEIPGSSDLIRFAVREAFDPATIQRFDYHKEFPREIIPWMEKQGYGQDTGIPRPAGATDNLGNPLNGNCTWSDLYWYSHWELPSLTQGYEMYHRLYSNSRYGPAPNVVGGNTFDGIDLEALQKAQDIPNYWRQRLQSISFHPLTRVDTKRMFESNVIDKARVYHTMREGGYNDRDANDLADWFELEKIKKLKAPPKKVASEYVCSHLHMGTIDEPEARRILGLAEYTIAETNDFIAKCDLTRRSKTIQIGLGALKNSYIQGGLSQTELTIELQNLGVSAVMVQNYITRWNLLKSFKYKLISAGQIAKAYNDYLITDSDVITKLSNLGYPKDEVYLILNSAKTKRIKAAIAAAKAQLLAVKKAITDANKLAQDNAKQAAKIVKEANKKAESAAKKRIRGLIEGASDKNIAKWYEAGLVMIDEIAFRLILRDYSLTDVKREIQTLDPSLTEVYINGEVSKAAKVYTALGYPPPTA